MPDTNELDDPLRPVVGWRQDHTESYHFPPHCDFRAQLTYAVSGVITVGTRTGTWVVPPAQAVWVPAGIEHEVFGHGPVSNRFLYVQPEAAATLPRDCRVVAVTELLRQLILRASDYGPAFATDGPGARLAAVILDELHRMVPTPLYLPLPTDPRLRVVTDGLTAAPADRRGLDDWAAIAGASARTLGRLFRAETGMTFGAWRRRLRLLEAIAWLGRGESVTTVAYDLGYDSPSAFIAMFRRDLGASPGRYLKLKD